MKTRLFRTALAAMLLTAIAVMPLAACAKASEAAKPSEDTQASAEAKSQAGDAAIKVDDNRVEYKSDDGKTSFTVDTKKSVEIPNGYPDDAVPIYPDGRVEMAGIEGEGFVIAIVTDDSIKDVYDYYKDNIKLDTLAMEQNTADMAMFMGISGGLNVSVMVTVNSMYEDGKNLIAIAIGK